MKISLTQLQTHKKAVVLEIQGGQTLQNKLLALGIYPGREIVKLSHFILRGPVAIRAGRTILALGFSMAGKIIVRAK